MNREPYPPAANRGDALGQLRRERWLAQDIGDVARVAELDRQIERLSAASSPNPPTRETAASAQPRATAAAANPKPKPTPKGNRRVSAR